jgi:polar amino acid transport system substrate-binding protein
MKKACQLIFIYIVIFPFCYCNLCFAEEIIIRGNFDKPPKIYQESGKAEGILIDIMKYIDQNMSQSFKYKLSPWKRAYENAKNGEGGVIGLSKNTDRLKIIDYSEVMFYDEVVLVVKKGNEFSFNSINDLKGKVVGYQYGASYGDEFEKGKNTIFIAEEDKSGKNRLLKLLVNRIDVAFLSPGKAGVNSVINQNKELLEKKNEFVILSEPFKVDPNYLGFAKTMNMQGFLKEFNKVLQKGWQTGDIQKIIENYSN